MTGVTVFIVILRNVEIRKSMSLVAVNTRQLTLQFTAVHLG
ncbi:hypothetical protein J048_2168 [Klebsiella pneumoniae 120_1020]|nr:hypothetical protein N559_0382 [Klebsiella pneumoniae JM45]EGF60496.1 hypothetical protein HMPREF9538_05091 [Klebsiella sp. MS 92-3]EJK89354.1 hypothetical protein UUU_39770 [Klebsiella pneumoniae subsp. pneumoniae DSM 30104 = JCM 1662 = NBRC 14940]EPB24144.1 hypothetical protein H216_2312 [Klebsiella pneumoniae DMC0526]EPO18888.1 hypothetical protein H217_3245 [Klebsiella pneumoniae DMC0799]EPP03272.1 hypothetical protein J048_2168 [Klebsiella pneumoniae 120_1020]